MHELARPLAPSLGLTLGWTQIIKSGLNGVQNRRFGLKIGPEACQDPSRALGMGLTQSTGPSTAKTIKKIVPAQGECKAGLEHDIKHSWPNPSPFDDLMDIVCPHVRRHPLQQEIAND